MAMAMEYVQLWRNFNGRDVNGFLQSTCWELLYVPLMLSFFEKGKAIAILRSVCNQKRDGSLPRSLVLPDSSLPDHNRGLVVAVIHTHK